MTTTNDISTTAVGFSEDASSIGLIGFIFAAVAVGLMVVVAVLWILMDKDNAQKGQCGSPALAALLVPVSRRT